MTDVPIAAPEAAATDPVLRDRPPRRRRRRALVLRFGVAFVLGLVLAVGLGAGALYAWGQQYQGLVLPGVRIGSTELGGLTREQAAAAIERAYAGLSSGEISLTGPDGQVRTISYADVGRGPDTSAMVEAALAAGHQGDSITRLVAEPATAIHGITLDAAVAYDRDKLARAVATFAATLDRAPVDATVSAAEATFSSTPSVDGRTVDEAALVAALDTQLATLDAPASIAMDTPMVAIPPTVTTETAQAAQAAATRMAADVVVTEGKDSWTVSGKKLAKLISFATAADGTITPVFDEAGLDPIMEKLAKKAERAAKDAGLRRVGSRIVAKGKSHEGRRLLQGKTKAAIVTELAARQGGAVAAPVAAVTKVLEPKLSSADAKRFAPKM
ncbi:MAG TPA: peptidoglycan binding domain-containing protein, partial [Candidatus Limnocylindrales bacterium]|nr:peptidoglycan binding domain-containing protein [Candidatus Limnocylindrales bacterium]